MNRESEELAGQVDYMLDVYLALFLTGFCSGIFFIVLVLGFFHDFVLLSLLVK